jgi:hypothetical protein
MNQVICQAPLNISIEIIEEVFNKNNQNVLDTLSELWQLEEKQLKEKSKWDTIRETCDEYDMEMSKVIKKTTVNNTTYIHR